MGVPAFDMAALEAAIPSFENSAVAILNAGPIEPGIEANDRSDLSRATDLFETEFRAWRDGIAASFEKLRHDLEISLANATLLEMRSNAEKLLRFRASFAEAAQHALGVDERIVAFFAFSSFDVAPRSVHAERFIEREKARIEMIRDARQVVFRKIDTDLQQIVACIDIFISSSSRMNTVGVGASSPHALSAERAPDVDGTSRRAHDLLARFPKTAAYLAR